LRPVGHTLYDRFQLFGIAEEYHVAQHRTIPVVLRSPVVDRILTIPTINNFSVIPVAILVLDLES
jgi:hypothetical protein